MREQFLPFSPPAIGEEEIAEVTDTLRSGWITTGPKTRRFEQEFAAGVGADDALALNSCTSALHLALAALGVGKGDVVATTPLTFCSTVHVIEQVGATPLLVDVSADTLNIDADQLAERLIDPSVAPLGRPRAVIPVHFAGHPCDLDAIDRVAATHGLAVIEDAAHAFPAHYRGRPIGQVPASGRAHAVCFSFYATKNLTTGEGGMLTATPELLEESRTLSLHGMSRDAWGRYDKSAAWYYQVVRPGYKYNMTDIQAAIGLQQLKKMPAFQARREAVAATYTEAFQEMPELQVPAVEARVHPAWHLYVLRLNLEQIAIDRDTFIKELAARNIGTSVHFIPIHVLDWYRDRYGFRPTDFPVAQREYERSVSLPIHPRMTDTDVADVVEAVKDTISEYT